MTNGPSPSNTGAPESPAPAQSDVLVLGCDVIETDLKGAWRAGHRQGRHTRQPQSACCSGNRYAITGDRERVAGSDTARRRERCRNNDVRQWR